MVTWALMGAQTFGGGFRFTVVEGNELVTYKIKKRLGFFHSLQNKLTPQNVTKFCNIINKIKKVAVCMRGAPGGDCLHRLP